MTLTRSWVFVLWIRVALHFSGKKNAPKIKKFCNIYMYAACISSVIPIHFLHKSREKSDQIFFTKEKYFILFHVYVWIVCQKPRF